MIHTTILLPLVAVWPILVGAAGQHRMPAGRKAGELSTVPALVPV
ncbi:MAG: hypothetical protein QG606_288 [Patescibacteria group bacterium]|nr:hypothetical protein [Patescibacteria group bacterium]